MDPPVCECSETNKYKEAVENGLREQRGYMENLLPTQIIS